MIWFFLLQWATLASAFSTSTPPKAPIPPTPHAPLSLVQRRVPWVIVGGGIHGVHIATRLLAEGIVTSPTDLCIIDDSDALLSKWKARTAATGMQYLRSSAGYHLDVPEQSLRQFAKKITAAKAKAATATITTKKGKSRNIAPSKEPLLFSKDYERPRLDLFNQHCDAIIEEYHLNEKHIQGKVVNLEPLKDYVRVAVSSSTSQEDNDQHQSIILADQVVLALGNDNPSYPDWVTEDLLERGKVRHLLDTDTDGANNNNKKESSSRSSSSIDSDASSVAIIGGGITAAHKTLQVAQQEGKTIHLISRQEIMEQQFDTHQDWMMDDAAAKRSQAGGGAGLPARQELFRCTCCMQQRRSIIARERIPGTVTAAVNRGRHGLQYAIQNDRVRWHQAEVIGLSQQLDDSSDGHPGHDKLELQLSSGLSIEVDQVLLATGFGKRPPGLIHMNKLDLPVSEFCGYPIVDSDLRWGGLDSRIFVSGALAELELGPSARNIAGARLAAERILRASRSQTARERQTESLAV